MSMPSSKSTGNAKKKAPKLPKLRQRTHRADPARVHALVDGIMSALETVAEDHEMSAADAIASLLTVLDHTVQALREHGGAEEHLQNGHMLRKAFHEVLLHNGMHTH